MFPPYTLDQLTMFIAVVDAGSFSAAGRRVGRVQSAVSSAIAQLEAALGSTLFDRSGHRPVLTDAGRRLAAEARLVLGQSRELSEAASRLRGGTEARLRLVVDAIYPAQRLIDACVAFQQAFPATVLRVEKALLGDAVARVREGVADLGACNLAGDLPADLATAHLGTVQLLPVCAPHHPLARAAAPQREGTLRQHVQIVQTQRLQADTADQGVLAPRTWRVSDLGLKRDLLLRGVGWGSLPAPMAEGLLREGVLVRLRPEPWPAEGHQLPLHAVTPADAALGPAGQWFRERLVFG